MKLHELSPMPGTTSDRKRVGRGAGSGNGKTAGKGHKGQKAVQAAQSVRALKAVRCLCKDVFLREDSLIFSEQPTL